MYSVNVPVPAEVSRLASGLGSACRTADRRTRRTLVVKRLGDGPYGPLAREVREALSGTAPFAARVATVDTFDHPPNGAAPVAYLAVEGQGIYDLHDRLCAVSDPVPGLEGEEYDPHVTIARGGDAGRLLEESVSPVTWEVDRLALWDGRHLEAIESISLPA